MALTKLAIAERLAAEIGLNKREAKEFVNDFFSALREAIVKEGELKLSGFGKFVVRTKRSRLGRKLGTGEEIAISARQVTAFRAGQVLKDRIHSDPQ